MRTAARIVALLWMALALCPETFARNGWHECALIAGVAYRHCFRWHWLAVLAALILWDLAAEWRRG